MAQPPTHENTGSILKFLIYMSAVGLGLVSRLATANNESKLTWKIVIAKTAVAGVAAFVTWFFLKEINAHDNTKYICGAIVARYGDSVTILMWQEFKKFIKGFASDIDKIDMV